MNEQLKILIVFENLRAAASAQDLCARIKNALQAQLEMDSEMWEFGELAQPHLCRRAAIDAAGSDMVIVSTYGAKDLAPHIKQWIDAWIVQERTQPTALVALTEQRSQGGLLSTIPAYLRRAADEGGLDFFFPGYKGKTASLEGVVAALNRGEAPSAGRIEEFWAPARCRR